MNPLETYLKELSEIRSSGAAVKETSYYGPLASLFNEIGKTLKPKVRCIINLQNQGAGMPDGGFFTQEQFQKAGDHEPMPGQMPARGAIEVKSTKDDAWVTADGDQVSRYLEKYRQVLVTNYRDFVLVGQDASGQAVTLEIYRLADSEADFWAGARHPRRMAQEEGERFIEYLKRVMLHAAPLTGPADVAWFLASYARDAKARLEGKDLPALTGLRTALEEALGLKFEGDKGDHFFRSTLVQTLFYGVFAAWVLWHKKNPIPAPKKLLDWRLTPFYLRVPMIRVLYEQVAAPSKLGPLGPGRGGRGPGAPAGRAEGPRPVRRKAGGGTGDQGEGAGPPRGLNLSPRTVDAQVQLRSGRDNRGTSLPTGVGNGSRTTTEKAAGTVTKEHIYSGYGKVFASVISFRS